MKIPEVRKNINRMSGYVPGEQPKGLSRIIKLNTNENPYPPSPEAKKALENFDWQRLNRYPDPVGQALREEIAAYHGVSPDMIICANGSDDILTIVSRCFIDPDHALACPDPTYSLYVSLASLQDAPCIRIPLLDGFELPDDFEEKVRRAMLSMTKEDLLICADVIENIARNAKIVTVGGAEHLTAFSEENMTVIEI